MVALKEHYPQFTPDEYFAWEEQQLERHEYIDGEVYAMSGGTQNHSNIALNFGGLLKSHLRGSGCRTFNSDLRIKIFESNKYVYPDLSVTCDQRDKTTPQYISHPCLVVEVLSPSTEAYDRGNKFRMYRLNPSLRDYVLVDTNKMAIDLYRRDEAGNWNIINYEVGDEIELRSINLTLPIEQIYEDIEFIVDDSDRSQSLYEN